MVSDHQEKLGAIQPLKPISGNIMKRYQTWTFMLIWFMQSKNHGLEPVYLPFLQATQIITHYCLIIYDSLLWEDTPVHQKRENCD